MSMSHINIDVENISFAYEKERSVLQNITFHAESAEAVGLIGANGVGKSTLLKLLVGLVPDFSGSVRIGEIPLEKKTLPLIREKIGYVFQDSDSQLFMTNVYDDVAFAPRNYGLPEEEVAARTEQALAQTHTGHLRDRQIYRLSGGEKKLVSIATVLSMMPDILLMDEPSVALDPKNRRNLIHILNECKYLKIIASHDLDFIWDTCSRVLLMAEGRIIRDGRPDEILTYGALLEQYGLELPLSLCRRDK